MPSSFSLSVKFKRTVMTTDNRYQYSSFQGKLTSDPYEAEALFCDTQGRHPQKTEGVSINPNFSLQFVHDDVLSEVL